MLAAVRLEAIHIHLLFIQMLNHPVAIEQPAWQRQGRAFRNRRQELFDMPQVPAQILQLLFDAFMQDFAARALLFGDVQIRVPGLLTRGSGFVVAFQVGAECVDDLFAEFTGFIK